MRKKTRRRGVIMLAGVAATLVARPAPVRADCVSYGCAECCIAVDDKCAVTHGGGNGSCDPEDLPVPNPPDPPDPPEEDDTTFVWVNNSPLVNCDPDDQEVPMRRFIRVTRYVGKTFSRSGFLREPAAMVAADVLGPTARLTIMAWDVDRRGSACGGSEVDTVHLNIASTGGKNYR